MSTRLKRKSVRKFHLLKICFKLAEGRADAWCANPEKKHFLITAGSRERSLDLFFLSAATSRGCTWLCVSTSRPKQILMLHLSSRWTETKCQSALCSGATRWAILSHQSPLCVQECDWALPSLHCSPRPSHHSWYCHPQPKHSYHHTKHNGKPIIKAAAQMRAEERRVEGVGGTEWRLRADDARCCSTLKGFPLSQGFRGIEGLKITS